MIEQLFFTALSLSKSLLAVTADVMSCYSTVRLL